MGNRFVCLALAFCLIVLAGAGWAASYHYSGRIGSRQVVQMDLTR